MKNNNKAPVSHGYDAFLDQLASIPDKKYVYFNTLGLIGENQEARRKYGEIGQNAVACFQAEADRLKQKIKNDNDTDNIVTVTKILENAIQKQRSAEIRYIKTMKKKLNFTDDSQFGKQINEVLQGVNQGKFNYYEYINIINRIKYEGRNYKEILTKRSEQIKAFEKAVDEYIRISREIFQKTSSQRTAAEKALMDKKKERALRNPNAASGMVTSRRKMARILQSDNRNGIVLDIFDTLATKTGDTNIDATIKQLSITLKQNFIKVLKSQFNSQLNKIMNDNRDALVQLIQKHDETRIRSLIEEKLKNIDLTQCRTKALSENGILDKNNHDPYYQTVIKEQLLKFFNDKNTIDNLMSSALKYTQDVQLWTDVAKGVGNIPEPKDQDYKPIAAAFFGTTPSIARMQDLFGVARKFTSDSTQDELNKLLNKIQSTDINSKETKGLQNKKTSIDLNKLLKKLKSKQENYRKEAQDDYNKLEATIGQALFLLYKNQDKSTSASQKKFDNLLSKYKPKFKINVRLNNTTASENLIGSISAQDGHVIVNGKLGLKADVQVIIDGNDIGINNGDIKEVLTDTFNPKFKAEAEKIIKTHIQGFSKTEYQRRLKSRGIQQQIADIMEKQGINKANAQSTKIDIAVLQQIQKETDELLSRIRAEDENAATQLENILSSIQQQDISVKDYTMVTQESGFHGGSLGANLKLQITNINDIYSAGGMQDTMPIDQLQWLIKNAGDQALGKPIISDPLTNYLTAAGQIMMFNTGTSILQSYTQNVTMATEKIFNDKYLHLYALNGIFVPSSFLLEMIYNKIVLTSRQLTQYGYKNQAKMGSTVVVDSAAQISNINPNLPIKKRWQAIDSIRPDLKLFFMQGFGFLLQQLRSITP